MSELLLHPALFQGQTIHTVTIGGRPAWIARDVGEVLGYADRKRLVGKITLEWADDFVLGKDYVSCHAKGLLVLFESGLHLVCVKTHMPLGRALRRFLVDEVLPQLVRTGAYKPAGADEPAPVATLDVATLREARLAARVDLDDRKFRCAELQRTADLLRFTRRIDGDTWARCQIAACEIALGHALPGLYAAIDRWTDAAALAAKLDVPIAKVLTAASQLQLLDDKPGLTRPFPPARATAGRSPGRSRPPASPRSRAGWPRPPTTRARRPPRPPEPSTARSRSSRGRVPPPAGAPVFPPDRQADLRAFLAWILDRHASLGGATELRVLGGARGVWSACGGPADLDGLVAQIVDGAASLRSAPRTTTSA